jgi:hypothetical protein
MEGVWTSDAALALLDGLTGENQDAVIEAYVLSIAAHVTLAPAGTEEGNGVGGDAAAAGDASAGEHRALDVVRELPGPRGQRGHG